MFSGLEAQGEINRLLDELSGDLDQVSSGVAERRERRAAPRRCAENHREVLDVVIVGAGAAGVGCGVVLRDMGLENFVLLEQRDVGSSFELWPREMRFITPSFTSNAFGMTDLNAVALGTSPAYSLGREHPSGQEYALYLRAVADHFELPVRTRVGVGEIESLPEGGFRISTSAGDLYSRFVIWAAGEFQYPRLDPFPGSELCFHNAQVRSWKQVPGEEVLVIGGHESGMDAAINLSSLDKRVYVADAGTSWENDAVDPSRTLSPYTLERIEAARATGLVELAGEVRITRVEKDSLGYAAYGTGGKRWLMPNPPVLATGFEGSLGLVSDLFDFGHKGEALLTEEDESTNTPGLFLAGPRVRHGDAIFCFIYKFRQRFAVVANAIGERLSVDTSPLELYRENGMFLDDLSCCKDECAC